MAVEKMTENVEVVQTLSTYPNQEEGLSAEQLKAKFDQGPKALKEYLNNVLVPAVQGIQNAMDAGEQYGLDTTLSVPGRAADAAAVGQRFMNLKASDVGARPDTWLPTIAEIGAAPAGYGIGGTVKHVATFDGVDSAGWYSKWFNEDEVPTGAAHGSLTFRTGIYGSPEYFEVIMPVSWTLNDYSVLSEIRKRRDGDNWTPWEWVNPPMIPGIEYRTTERWNGKAVYTKMVETTWVTDGYIIVPFSSGTMSVPIEWTGMLKINDTDGYALPCGDDYYIEGASGGGAGCCKFFMRGNGTATGTLCLQVWYV